MKLLPILIISAIVFGVVSHRVAYSSGDGQAEQTTRYALAANGSISVENASGDIEINGWDESQVQLTVRKRASSDDELAQLSAPVGGSQQAMTVQAHYPDDCDQCDIELILNVPRDARVNLDSASGDITVSQTNGSIRAFSESGEVKLTHTAGPAQVHTSSGDVKIADAGGDVDGGSTSGDIDASGLRADATLRNASGDVSASFASWDRVHLVQVDTSSGDIEVKVPRSSGFRLDAVTASGSIDSNLKLPIDDQNSGAAASAQVGRGSAVMQIRSASGDIDLTMR